MSITLEEIRALPYGSLLQDASGFMWQTRRVCLIHADGSTIGPQTVVLCVGQQRRQFREPEYLMHFGPVDLIVNGDDLPRKQLRRDKPYRGLTVMPGDLASTLGWKEGQAAELWDEQL